jgi:hypothetical protein
MVQGQSRQIVQETPISKNNQSKRDWRCGLSDRLPVLWVPTLQEWSPEFKPQSHQKTNKQLKQQLTCTDHMPCYIWLTKQFYKQGSVITIPVLRWWDWEAVQVMVPRPHSWLHHSWTYAAWSGVLSS